MSSDRVSVGGFSLPVAARAPRQELATATPEATINWGGSHRDRVSQSWTRIRDWVNERFLVTGTTLKRRDHARWQRAETLQDLADLTASWLSGDIASQPGYYGRVDVDEDDAPGLTAALVASTESGSGHTTPKPAPTAKATTACVGPSWPRSTVSPTVPLSAT